MCQILLKPGKHLLWKVGKRTWLSKLMSFLSPFGANILCRSIVYLFIFLKYCFLYFLLVVLGLYCSMWAFSSCSKQRPLSSWITWASHCGAWSLGQAGFSSCTAWAQLPCSMWGLPEPGIEPGFSALAVIFLTIGSSGKSCSFISENAFFWISFPFNVVSETSPLKINPFHGVEEYNIQSDQILRFKDTNFFLFLQILFSANCLVTNDNPLPSLLYV